MNASLHKNWLAASICLTVVLASALVVVALEATRPLADIYDDEQPEPAPVCLIDDEAEAARRRQETVARIEKAVTGVLQQWAPKIVRDAEPTPHH